MFRIIINPGAGSGQAQAILPLVEEELRKRGISYDIARTQEKWQAAALAAQAVQDRIEGVIVIGGDGTLFEAANGLAQTNTVLYAVPCGTGNDFVRCMKLPKDPLQALQAQLDSPIGRVDVGAAGNYRFLNVAGAGFDVEVLRQTDAFKKRFRGIVPYLLGIVHGIGHYKPFKGELEVNGRKICGRFTIVVFANGQYIGGGMRVARRANLFDGLFDVIYVPALPKWFICLILPLFIPGWYDVLPIAHRVQASAAQLHAAGLTVNLDGELRDMDHVDFRVIPSGVRMALPHVHVFSR